MDHRISHTEPTTDATADPSAAGQSLELHPAVLTGALVTGLIVALVVAVASFKLSFSTLFDLAAMAGLHRPDAWVIPVVLDGPILAAGIIRIALSQHTDQATVRGRRFIVAVFALAGAGSMAGNAYHAVLTVTELNAAVAAVIGALAPLMVMTMSEMIAIAISAPRRRHTIAQLVETGTVDESDAVTPSSDATTHHLEDMIDGHGNLTADVWETVDLYLNHPTAKGNFSAVARLQEKSTSTITRRYDRWIEAQQAVASSKVERIRGDLIHGGESSTHVVETVIGVNANQGIGHDLIAVGR